MRHLSFLVVLVAAAAALAAPAGGAPSERFTHFAEVERIIDGDTVEVMLYSGRRERVRLVGIATQACHAERAAAFARRVADGRHVRVVGDGALPTRDAYGRLVAYVWLEGRRDLGFQLVRRGFARVYRRPFGRLYAYRRAERVGRALAQTIQRDCRSGANARSD